jgi:hypothetical protein
MSERVQIPAYTDAWMMGDRYGDVVKVTKQRRNFPIGCKSISADDKGTYVEVAHVLCDKSGKVRKVIYDDCTPV